MLIQCSFNLGFFLGGYSQSFVTSEIFCSKFVKGITVELPLLGNLRFVMER